MRIRCDGMDGVQSNWQETLQPYGKHRHPRKGQREAKGRGSAEKPCKSQTQQSCRVIKFDGSRPVKKRREEIDVGMANMAGMSLNTYKAARVIYNEGTEEQKERANKGRRKNRFKPEVE